jgi:type IV secretion system protein VirB10
VELQPAKPQKNIFTTFPDVVIPSTITDGSLPSRNTSDGTTNVQTVFRTAPGRYLFNNLSPEALGAQSMIMASSDESTQFNPSTFSPMGETIQLAMMENATTQNTEINITACVWEPFYFQGNKLLDIGDKILGTAAKGKKRDRMVVNFYKIIFKDGRSLPINAVAQDIDGTFGVKGVKIGDVMLNSIAPLLLDTAAAFTGVIQELAYANVEALTVGQIQTQNPNVGLNPNNQNPNAQFAQDSAQTGGEGIGTVYQTISKLLAEDVEENQPYLLVPAGTRLQAYLRAPLDVSKAEYGK